MELIIRSQDKLRLVKQYAFIDIFNPCEEDKEFMDRNIYAYINKDIQVLLGEYKTSERAKEILDEIQNILKPKAMLISNKDLEENDIKVYGIEQINSYVYEMPKE